MYQEGPILIVFSVKYLGQKYLPNVLLKQSTEPENLTHSTAYLQYSLFIRKHFPLRNRRHVHLKAVSPSDVSTFLTARDANSHPALDVCACVRFRSSRKKGQGRSSHSESDH